MIALRSVAIAGLLALVPAAIWAQDNSARAPGIVVSDAQIVLSSQVAARILEMPNSAGTTFDIGDTLVRFDCTALEARREGQAAQVAGLDREHQINVNLQRSGAVSEGAVIRSETDAAIAAADLRALEIELASCHIDAPFSGRIVQSFSRQYENVVLGDELLEIVDNQNLAIELIVPSLWLRWMTIGTEFEFLVFETETAHSASVDAIGAVVDPVSQTIRIEAVFQDDPQASLPGMSGEARFLVPQ